MKVFVSTAIACLMLISVSAAFGADKEAKAKAKPKATPDAECNCEDGKEPQGPTRGDNQMCAIFPLYALEPDEPGQEKYVYYALFYEGCDDEDPSPDYLIGLYYWEAICGTGQCVEARRVREKFVSACGRNDGHFEGMDGEIAGDFEILERDGVQDRDFEIPKGPARKSSRRVNVPKCFLQFTPFGQTERQTFRVFGIDRATKKDKGAADDEEDIIYVAYQTEDNSPPGGKIAAIDSVERIRTSDFAYRVKAVVNPQREPVSILVLLAK